MADQQQYSIGEVYRLIESLRDNEVAEIKRILHDQNSRIQKTENRLTRLETITGLVGTALTGALSWLGWVK